MIQANERKQINKRLDKQYRLSAANAQGQTTLNVVLWRMIMQHVHATAAWQAEKNGEAFVAPQGDCAVRIPIGDIDVPKNFALKIKVEDEILSVIATTVKPKSNILLADGSQAPS